MLEAAIKYASLGWKIFPITEGCKAPPATPNGYKDATNESAKVFEWFGNGRKYNLAISTGRDSGFFSLDVDCKKGKDGFIWLNAQDELPNTIVQKTPSGGKQFFFKMPDFPVYCSSDKIAEGIDIRGDGGYVLTPPSFCKKTPLYDYEGAYEFMSEQGAGEIEIAPAPQWLLDILFDLLPVETIPSSLLNNNDKVVPIRTVMEFYKIKLKETKSGVFQGAHPLHGSSNGFNFKIDTNINLWSCYRHTKEDGKPVGGGSMQLIAMMEGIIDCEECKKGALRGANYNSVKKVLKDKFGISDEELKTATVDKMYQIAEYVRDGGLGLDFIYCVEDNKYYKYEDGYWKDLLEGELALILNRNVKDINKHTLSMKNQIFGHLRVELQKRMSCFNNSKRLNFPECEYDPATNAIHKHDKDNYSTTRLPYSYNPEAKCPMWIKALNEMLEDNQEKIDTLQEFFGYCLHTEMQLKKALLLLGESNTGKSTVLFVLEDILGEINYSSVSLKNMGHPQYTPMMINKLVNIDSDVDRNATDYEANFKKITSFEEIECNQKYIAAFRFRPECRIVLAANIFPKITDHSSAFYNRLIVVPFDRIFDEEEQDPMLRIKLKSELSGIFNWCVEGYQRLKQRGKFKVYDFSKQAVDELEDNNNPSNLFFREHIEISVNDYIEKGDLYAKYRIWSETNKQYTLPSAVFSMAVYKQFHKQTPKNAHMQNGKRIWRNLKYVEIKFGKVENKGWTD